MPNRRSLRVDSHRVWIGEFADHVALWSKDKHPTAEYCLLLTLSVLAIPRSGLVMIEKARLVWILAYQPDLVDRLLTSLAKQRLVQLMEAGPYLVISLKRWSGNGARAGQETSLENEASDAKNPPSKPPPAATATPLRRASDYAVSTATASAERHSAERAQGDGVKGAGSGEEDPIATVIAELRRFGAHESDLDGLPHFCSRYPQATIEAALRRLRRTPRERIRKSPAALFTFLIKTIDRDQRP